MDALKVRQVVFNFDKKSSFRYDVNQNIRIIDLKRMIETALQIPRYKIKLYHNNVNFTEMDDSKIEQLIPDLQKIEFQVVLEVGILGDAAEKEIAIKLRLGDFCELHTYKYPCHFCFDCNKSFCSICNVENLHLEHETIEKYDYLQDTQVIVNSIFRKITDDFKNLKSANDDNLTDFEDFIRVDLFNRLKELVTHIENKIKNVTKIYWESSKNSLKQIEENVKIIKQNCVEALNKRKEELQMSNMLIDESVIINYYNTILQIHNQKQAIEMDKNKFFEFEKSVDLIKPLADDIFNQIKKFLEEKSNLEWFTKCEHDLSKCNILPINPENIKENLQRDILNSTNKKPLGYTSAILSGLKSDKKKFHHLEQPFHNVNDQNEDDKISIVPEKISRLDEVKSVPSNHFQLNFERNNENYIDITKKNVNTSSKISPIPAGIDEKNADNINNSIRNTEIKQKFSDNVSCMEVEESVWGKIENESFVFTIQPETKNVFVYSEQRQKVKKYSVNFPILKAEKNFLKGCSWVNANGKLYVSGGMSIDLKLRNEFFYYDNNDNSIKFLKELHENRANHSMFFYDKHIYIIGGETSNSTEIYDIGSGTSVQKENINYEKVDNPILWIHNGFLYSFFGIKGGINVDFVQRANLKLEKLKWEKVAFKKSDEINCKFIGAGIIPCGPTEIYFFGGKNENNDVTNQSIIFNFDNKEFSNAYVPLEQGQYFKDTRFIELSNQTFGQFSLTECDNFLKINVSYA